MAFDLSNLSNDQGIQLASIGANLAGTGLQYNASQNAAQQQKDAAAAAAKLQADMRGPWVAAGTQALGTLQTGLAPGGQFSKPFSMADATNTAAMKFAAEQGQQEIANTAAARGGLMGTNAEQAAIKFAEQNAAQFQNQAFNQSMAEKNQQLAAQQSLAGIGQTNLNAVADAGSNSLLAAGGAGAAGTVGGANVLSQGLTTLGGGASTYNALSKLLGTGGGGGTGTVGGGITSTGGIASPFGTTSTGMSATPYGGTPNYSLGGGGSTSLTPASNMAPPMTPNLAPGAPPVGQLGGAELSMAGDVYPALQAGQLGGAELAMGGDAVMETVAASAGFWETAGSVLASIFELFSDERMKKDINRVGATDAGVPIYTYKMKSGGPVQMGVMAQELEQVKPDAVRMHHSGYRMVDYGKVS